MEAVEFFLSEGSEYEVTETIKLIKKGICFIAYQVENEIRFAPSRFIGYKNNTPQKHVSPLNAHRHGTKTNAAIKDILRLNPSVNSKLRERYVAYCKNLGVEADKKKHRFWQYNLLKDFKGNELLTGEFPEGKVIEKIHKLRERNSNLIKSAKENFILKNGTLFCEACKFDFEKTYGKAGKHFIEGHHLIEVCKMPPGYKTRITEIGMLCPNCHSMAHKIRPWPSIKDLIELLKTAAEKSNR